MWGARVCRGAAILVMVVSMVLVPGALFWALGFLEEMVQ